MSTTTIKVTVGKYHGPRKSERTWPMIRASISHAGRKSQSLATASGTNKVKY